MFKKQLSSRLGSQLVCALADGLAYDAEQYCWKTAYPHYPIKKEKEAPHDDFDQYLKIFQAGLHHYNCKSKEKLGYDWHKIIIEKNIQGFKKTTPNSPLQCAKKRPLILLFSSPPSTNTNIGTFSCTIFLCKIDSYSSNYRLA